MKMESGSRALDKIYRRRDRYQIPDWQREDVWDSGRQRLLIDSILRGWKLPKFYFLQTSENPDEYDVLDGQQRLNAIWEFLDGDLQLDGATATLFGGVSYTTLPDALVDAFDDYEIEFDVITDFTDEESKEFFKRLQSGLPLSSSEKLNAVHSKLRDYCVRAAKHEFFSKTTTISGRRYAYFDVVAKVAAIELEGLDVGLRLDDVTKVFETYSGFSGNTAVAKRVNKALDILRVNFPDKYQHFRNRTVVQSVVTLVCHLQAQGGLDQAAAEKLKTFIDGFLKELAKQVDLGQQATDADYVAFQRTVNANIKSGTRTRQAILLRKLFSMYPDFYTNFSQSPALAASVSGDISRLAASIRRLATICNERHAAKHGADLFKLTNKGVTALGRLDQEVRSVDDYGRFIDDLYFVFREGVGPRLDGQMPPAFDDANSLRTMIRHDVDHGKASKIAKQRKDLAATFSKFSGVGSPDAVDPTQFPLVQANILGALELGMQALARSLV
jgi:hypothetical protein